MTPTAKLVYDVRRKRNENNAGAKARTPLVDVIAALNQAQETWFTNLVTVAERDSKARDDLRIFEEKGYELEVDKTGGFTNVYKLPNNIYKRLNQYAVACKKCCPNIEKRIIIRYVHPDYINEAHQNPFRRADFEYEQLTGDEAGSSLHVHHQGAMELKSCVIDYYRTPNPLHAPSLVKCNDEAGRYYDFKGAAITQDTFFEPIGRFADQQVTDLAVIILANSGDDYQALQAKLQTAMALSNIYTN